MTRVLSPIVLCTRQYITFAPSNRINSCFGYRPAHALPGIPATIGSVSSKNSEGGGAISDYPGVPDGLASIAGVSSQKAPRTRPDTLSKRWGISLEAARRTIKCTTQRGVRSVLHPPRLDRRFRTNNRLHVLGTPIHPN